MRKILIALSICFILLITGGTALAQGGGAGWFDFVTDVRLHGQVWILNDLTIGDDLTVDAVTAADLIATDDVTVGDDLTVTDSISNTWEAQSERTAITVDESTTITPTGTYQRITSTRNAGTSSIVAGTEGQRLVLVNIGSNTITLTDTGTLKLTGNIALGQFDTLSLLADGTNWVMLGTANN